MKSIFAILGLTVTFLFATFSLQASELEALKTLAVQDGGRVKPYDTFARESLQLLYGKQKYNGKDASEIVFTWFLIPNHWEDKEFIQIRRHAIKEALKLPAEKTYFSPREILGAERLPLLIQDLRNRVEAKEKLDPYYQDVQRLESQLGLYRAIAVGMAQRFLPPKEGDAWVSLHEMTPEWRLKFDLVSQAFAQALKDPPEPGLAKAVEDFKAAARAENPGVYPPENEIQIEVHYNKFHPFQWAWISYLTAALLLGWSLIGGKSALPYKLSWLAVGVGFLLHSYGFGLRMFLTGRPPVSNMYESVIWVSWGTMFFGMIFEALRKTRYVAFSASVVSVLCLIVADLSPNILDPSLQPLEPVLRSNLWLTVHVLTITISYSAFFLALVMGNVGVYQFLKGQKAKAVEISSATYRVVQVGVVLLAAGTILGGIWADYSWGRFWGWDPKETWAFIALMGYLAVLHAKKSGMIRDFGFLVGAIVSFSLVLMAWYGVNFVLGVGLHSYGFGGGGVPYVAAFVGIHLVYVAFAITVYRQKSAG